MALKIFVPDIKKNIDRKVCVLPLIPFLTNDLSSEQRVEKFGNWINQIQLVNDVESCDFVMPAHYVNNYYYKKEIENLQQINKLAIAANKLTVCFTNGDWGVTPKLNNFHLYRFSGYRSKNSGNQFCCPFFLGSDPLYRYYDGKLPVHNQKPIIPVIGFCGRASGNIFGWGTDIVKDLGRSVLKLAGKWPEDIESFHGSSYKRYHILKELEQSPLFETNFILHKTFKGGGESAEEKRRLSEMFYINMKQSHYAFCYRGWGNYSIRLYEALASGRIPFIIDSDNNLPFPGKINWNMFPVASHSDRKNIPSILASFHAALSNNDFVNLQYKARAIWEQFCTYNGYMEQWVNKYLQHTNNLHSL